MSVVASSHEKWLMISFSGTVLLSKLPAINMYYFYNSQNYLIKIVNGSQFEFHLP